MLGHVEAFGRNADDTWWFYDPQRVGTFMLVAHRFDEVAILIEDIRSRADRIYRVPERTFLSFPSLLPMTCATQCGHLVGLRAWTPAGLERKLRTLNAEVVHDSERRSRG